MIPITARLATSIYTPIEEPASCPHVVDNLFKSQRQQRRRTVSGHMMTTAIGSRTGSICLTDRSIE